MAARPPVVTKRLNLWWVLAAGIVVALGFGATDHMLRCTGTLTVTLLVCAVLRAFLPDETAGGLVVRRPVVDVLVLSGLGIAVGVVGFSLDLTALV